MNLLMARRLRMGGVWVIAVCLQVCVAGGSASAQERGPERGTEAMASLGAEEVAPATVDPGLKTTFDSPNVVVMPTSVAKSELVVLLPGTGGRPANYSALIKALSDGSYRVIGLMYDDQPSEAVACGKSGDLECHRNFREERFAGDAPKATVQNTADEGIDHRLVMLLKYLDKEHPKDGWGQYLAGDQPAWKRIIITGHSQGSGHAAYIAKHYEVARVVLFSGPYDGIDLRTDDPKLANWLTDPTKTPMDRWYAEYHEKDLGMPVPPMTLAALKVPADHILVSHLSSPVDSTKAYHAMGTHDLRMLPEWKWLFGIEGGTK